MVTASSSFLSHIDSLGLLLTGDFFFLFLFFLFATGVHYSVWVWIADVGIVIDPLLASLCFAPSAILLYTAL